MVEYGSDFFSDPAILTNNTENLTLTMVRQVVCLTRVRVRLLLTLVTQVVCCSWNETLNKN